MRGLLVLCCLVLLGADFTGRGLLDPGRPPEKVFIPVRSARYAQLFATKNNPFHLQLIYNLPAVKPGVLVPVFVVSPPLTEMGEDDVPQVQRAVEKLRQTLAGEVSRKLALSPGRYRRITSPIYSMQIRADGTLTVRLMCYLMD